MKSKICQIPFSETEEQKAKLEEIIATYCNKEGGIMPALQQAQEVYGYLPYEVQKRIADGLNLSMEEVYGIVTFYSQFSLNPKGKYNFSVCLGTACYVKGAGEIMERLKQVLNIEEGGCTPDGLFSIQATRCVGCCGLAPVMSVNDEIYGKITPDDVERIVKKYKDAENL